MSTGQFFTALFIGAVVELLVLCIGVPVIMWVHARTSLVRARARRYNQSTQWARDAEELLGTVYASIKSGETVAPKELEENILDAYSEGKNTYHREELL